MKNKVLSTVLYGVLLLLSGCLHDPKSQDMENTVYHSKVNEEGKHVMQFSALKGLFYEVNNIDTNEVYRGKINNEGLTEAIITDKPARYHFKIIWITAVPKKKS